MRISTWRTWLPAAAALLLGVANGVANGDRVQFEDGFDGPVVGSILEVSITSLQHADHSKTFSWTSSGVRVAEINLYTYDENTQGSAIVVNLKSERGSSLGGPGTPDVQTSVGKGATTGRTGLAPTNTQSNGAENTAPATDVAKTKRQGPPTPFKLDPSNINAIFDDSGGQIAIPDFRAFIGSLGQTLYFEAVWENNGGHSYSRPFVVLALPVTEEQRQKLLTRQPMLRQETPFRSERDTSPNLGGGVPTTTTTSPSSTPTAQISSGETSGLPMGAIIGIAVGCGLVGLALIGGLVWLFLRRRKAKEAAELGGYGGPGRTRTDELIAEKEGNAGLETSPHSPYSDDGITGAAAGGAYRAHENGSVHRGAGSSAAAAAAVAHHPHQSPSQTQAVPRSYTPYSDRHSAGVGSPSTRAGSIVHPDTSRGNVESPVPGRATPHALPAQYAHLVEEGMTEAEIRRLEEEERQLDAAIEQAGRRP